MSNAPKHSKTVKDIKKEALDKGKGPAVEEEGVTENGVWFCSKTASMKWSIIQKRKVISEGVLQDKKWNIPEVILKLEEAGLVQSVKAAKPFEEQVIRELIANISEGFGDILEEDYGVVKVRGRSVKITPELINEHLGISSSATTRQVKDWHEVARVLTNGKVNRWKGQTLESKHLTTLYALLHGICIKNWMHVTHRSTISMPIAALLYRIGKGEAVDLGDIIFDQFYSHYSSKSPVHPIGHPSTIYELILQQAPEILEDSASLTTPKLLITDWKLFRHSHFVDVSVPQSIQDAVIRHGKISGNSPKVEKNENTEYSSSLGSLKNILRHQKAAVQETERLIASLGRLMASEGVVQSEEEESESEEE